MSDFESGREQLGLLEKLFSTVTNRNEATTRLHLIDRLFFACLAWSQEDVVCEEEHGGEFADYTFSAPRRLLIVEAKREGNYFELPVSEKKSKPVRSLKSLMRDYPDLEKAIRQVTGYCQSRGVPLAAVTNGHQIVAFVATRNDGVPPFDGKALVFDSLKAISDNWVTVWNSLSKDGVIQQYLRKELVGDIAPSPPPKLSAKIQHYPGAKNRNKFQADLLVVSEIVIEDVVRSRDLEPRFLQECYCQSGALSQFSMMSKALLSVRYAALFDDNRAPTLLAANPKAGLSKELLAEGIARRPILLIGDIGVGKTTFIRNLIVIDAEDQFKRAITFYLDLGSQGTITEDIRTYVVREISAQLRANYGLDPEKSSVVREVYASDLESFSQGIYGELRELNPTDYKLKEIEFLAERLKSKDEHLRKVLQHFSQKIKKQPVIFLDNSDQRSEETQQQAFLIAQEFSDSWQITTFLTLRPQTFNVSLKRGALTGYHPKAFTISPPRIDLVLAKRLEFALRLASGEVPLGVLPEGVQIDLSSLHALVKSFLSSLRVNKDLMEFIDNITNGNVRFALDLIRSFFGSGHVDTPKIVALQHENEQRGDDYTVPLHEFVRAVIYGDTSHYNPDTSPIANLFDISTLDSREHFLLPIVLGALTSLSSVDKEEGFVETGEVYEKVQGLGFTPEQIDDAIARGYGKKLLETVARRIPEVGQKIPGYLRATPVGIYHVKRLCTQFAYLDAMAVDIPILDDSLRHEIRDVESIQDRLRRAEILFGYLDTQWRTFKPAPKAFFDWPSISSALRKDINQVRKRVTEPKRHTQRKRLPKRSSKSRGR